MKTINGLQLRAVFGRGDWLPPDEFGPDGWRMIHRRGEGSVIVSAFTDNTGTDWVHASVAFRDRIPTYEDLTTLHTAVWGKTGWAYQVFAPRSEHVNIHEHALHLWGRVDGRPVLPNFGEGGSI